MSVTLKGTICSMYFFRVLRYGSKPSHGTAFDAKWYEIFGASEDTIGVLDDKMKDLLRKVFDSNGLEEHFESALIDISSLRQAKCRFAELSVAENLPHPPSYFPKVFSLIYHIKYTEGLPEVIELKPKTNDILKAYQEAMNERENIEKAAEDFKIEVLVKFGKYALMAITWLCGEDLDKEVARLLP